MRKIIQKLRSLYRNASISRKFFLMYLVILIIPTLLLLGLMIHNLENTTRKNAYQKYKEHLHQLNAKINDRLSQLENVSVIAISQRDFTTFIDENMKADDLKLIKFKQHEFRQMDSIKQSNPLIERLSFYVSNPDLYEIWHLVYDYNLRFPDLNYWRKLQTSGGSKWEMLSITNPDELAEEMKTLSYYRLTKISGINRNEPTIMEIRVLHEKFFNDIIQEDENLSTYLYDKDAQDVLELSPIDEANDDSIKERIMHDFKSLEPENLVQIHHEEELNANLTYFYTYNQRLGVYVIDILNETTLLTPIRSFYPFIFLIGIAIMSVLLLALRTLTKRIFHRVYILDDSMMKVSQGDIAAKVPVHLTPGETGDVLDALALRYNSMLDEINHLMEQVVEKQMLSKNAQLKSLQNQINSHFLYNALESIRMLAVQADEELISEALYSLGQLMRYSLRWQSDMVWLREEIHNIQNYIFFINFMESVQFRLVLNIQEDLLNLEIPKMSLQPIVENIIHHAGGDQEEVTINLSLNKTEQFLIVEIQDNGVGIDPNALIKLRQRLQEEGQSNSQAADGIGLMNVNRRIQLQFGKEYGIDIDSLLGHYTKVSMRLPREQKSLGGW